MSSETLQTPEQISATEKLRFLKSPVLIDRADSLPLTNGGGGGAPDLSLFGDRFDHDTPQFQKHEDASLLELFFDLLFAANYTVFSQTQGVNSADRFRAYVGYFSILWITWLIVSLYDVRFVTDSIFERVARAVHMGVMIGFAVVAPNFKPTSQNLQTMRTMSLILCVSRFCLTVEYASILWHIRKYKKPRLPMLLQTGTNFAASMVYLGITFRFRHGNSQVYLAWYAMAAAEIIVTFGLAIGFSVLSFTGTHLMKRISTMTVLFLGDGVVIVAQNVVTIVKSPDAWDPQTIAIVTAAATTIYCVFLVYFDWCVGAEGPGARDPDSLILPSFALLSGPARRHFGWLFVPLPTHWIKTSYLPTFRQQFWTLLHFPLHLSMVLFMQGFTQFIIWSKIMDTLSKLILKSVFDDINSLARSTTAVVVDSLTTTINKFFEEYPPKYISTIDNVNWAVGNISELSDDFWPDLAKYLTTLNESDIINMTEFSDFWTSFNNMSTSLQNSLIETFGIDLVEEVTDANKNVTETGLESEVNTKMWARFDLVFQYAYIAAGITLIIMTILTIVARTKPWRKWSIVRTGIFFALGLGLSLVSTLHFNQTKDYNYKNSPWLLPTICLVWVLVLVITHIRNPSPLFFKRSQSFFSKPKHDYESIVPMTDGPDTRKQGN
ncbi:hypothetical protein EDB81DRAFT_891824 [Dactylonectria macrodidyma]|uniref:Low temperature requirement A n=1 Tax=Dactylonectria macrodidyma TaxID=307937 RepID=A0A9P9IH20_9HYPO|nr:hypothetical protein EDB81DRAFT_891824 [Dactylonectria macrodidyma]